MQSAAARRSVSGERLFEVTSVVPLTAFVVLHVLDHGRVLLGAHELSARAEPAAWLLVIEAMFVWAPLAFHALYSTVIYARRRHAHEPSATRSALLTLHRLSGVAAGLFLIDHFLRCRLPVLQGRAYPADALPRLAAELSATWAGVPLVATLHALGAVAVTTHLSLGLVRIAERRTGEAPRWARRGALALGLVIGVISVSSIVELSTGF